VAPGASEVSQAQHQTINVSERPTHNLPVPVTLRYTFKGQDVEQKDTLYVRRSTGVQ
jgi:hypothetical protein